MMWLMLSMVLGRASAADVQKGEAIYLANCMACHGVNADGQGPAAAALKPAPTNFTDAAFWKDRTDARLTASIRSGRSGTAMMGFARLSDEEMADLVAYLRTKAPGKPTE